MKNFILGFSFAALFIPLADAALSIVNQGAEYVCTKIAVKTYEAKSAIQEDKEEPETSSYAIGFACPSCEDEDDEEGE